MRVNFLFDALSRFGAQRLGRCAGVVFNRLLRGGSQESDLFAIPAAPFAKQKMQAQSDSLKQRQPVVQCF